MIPWTLSTRASGAAQQVDSPLAKDHAYEDYTYAALHCGGWFVEPNVIERDLLHQPLFECEAVLRKPFGSAGDRLLVLESKSGNGWGGKDVVQLLGRARYVDAEGSIFAYRGTPQRNDWDHRITDRLREVGLRMVKTVDKDLPTAQMMMAPFYGSLAIPPRSFDSVLYETLLLSYTMQRLVLRSVRWTAGYAGQPSVPAALVAARQWNEQVVESMPLIARPTERLVRQEASFQNFGRLLALRVAHELGHLPAGQKHLSKKMMESGEVKLVQAALLLQHVARLSQMASVVEIAHLPDATQRSATVMSQVGLRQHWRERVLSLADLPESARWPLLWQTYLTAWGGFLIEKRRDEELEMLGHEVGLSRLATEHGLKALDTFFPQKDFKKWQTTTKDGLETLILVPPAVRGLGVLHRLRRQGMYGLDETGHALVAEALTDKYGVAASAANRMADWHDVGIRTMLQQLL